MTASERLQMFYKSKKELHSFDPEKMKALASNIQGKDSERLYRL